MRENFFIDINCSKVLSGDGETQYTMFIDSSEMSIVYELVEWIRWIFSLENCFYITHNNSIIHELEDIEMLSILKNFELKPCGGNNCIHKNLYRSLLKNLNLFVTWNGTKVHKYFLYKISKVDKKLSNDSCSSSALMSNSATAESFMDYKNTEFNTNSFTSESNKILLCDNLQKVSSVSVPSAKIEDRITETEQEASYESSSKMNSCFEKKSTSHENLSSCEDKFNCIKDYIGTENLTIKTTKPVTGNISNSIPKKNKLKISQEPSKKNYVKPFSVGEFVSNIRDLVNKQNSLKLEEKSKQNSTSSNSLILKENDFKEGMTVEENTFVKETTVNVAKKRQRTRRRKKKCKQQKVDEFVPYFLNKFSETTDSNLDVTKCNSKPNHIRFDTDDEDNFVDVESLNEEFRIENQTKCEIVGSKLNDCDNFLQNEQVTTLNNINQSTMETVPDSFGMSNAENKMDCSVTDQFTTEENLVDLDVQTYNSSTNLNGKDLESKTSAPNINMLLSLKEKFKNAVIIERFY